MERKTSVEFILRKPGEYLGSQSSRIAAALALAEVGHRVFVGVSDILLREATSILLDLPGVRGRVIDAEGSYYNGQLVREPIITIFEESRLDFFIEKDFNIFEGSFKKDFEVYPILIASGDACSKITASKWIDDSPSYIFAIMQKPADMTENFYANLMLRSTESVREQLAEKDFLSPLANDYVYSTATGRKVIYGEENSGLDLYGMDTVDYVNQIMSGPMTSCLKNPDTRVSTHYVNYPTLTQGVWLHFK